MTRVRAVSEGRPSASKPRPGYVRACLNCGQALAPLTNTARFCSSPCRFAFDNRRKQRGAILYDLFMAQRYERDLAAKLGVWGLMCRAAQEWNNEDRALRGGRKSWNGPNAAIGKLTHLFATVLVRGRT